MRLDNTVSVTFVVNTVNTVLELLFSWLQPMPNKKN